MNHQHSKANSLHLNLFEVIKNKGMLTCISPALLCHHPPTVAHNINLLKALEYICFCVIVNIVSLDCHATCTNYWKGVRNGGTKWWFTFTCGVDILPSRKAIIKLLAFKSHLKNLKYK